MTGSIRAIETYYRGCRFRSRLEARWAVFFDFLAIKWIYEPEGFHLSNGLRYLPDFWLPTFGWWIEVKAALPNKTEMDKASDLAASSGDPVMVLCGDIWPEVLGGTGQVWVVRGGSKMVKQNLHLHKALNWAGLWYFSDATWALCKHCGHFSVRGIDYRFLCVMCSEDFYEYPKGSRDSGIVELLFHAYEAARSARFERSGMS